MGQIPVPKPLLPWKGKAILGHLIEEWNAWAASNNVYPMYYIVVRRSDKATQPYLALAYPELSSQFVLVEVNDDDTWQGPLFSIYRALSVMDKEFPFVCTVADGVYTPSLRLPKDAKNYLGVVPTSTTVNLGLSYLNVECIEPSIPSRFVDKQMVGTGNQWYSWSGVAYFRRTKLLYALLTKVFSREPVHKKEASYSDLFTSLNGFGEFGLWTQPFLDLGTKILYQKATASYEGFDYSKPDEITYHAHSSEKVVKFFVEENQAQLFYLRRKAFYDTRASFLFPSGISVYSNFVAYDKIPGQPLSETISPAKVENFLGFMFRNVWTNDNLSGGHLQNPESLSWLFVPKALARAYSYHMTLTGKATKVKTVNGIAVNSGGWVEVLKANSGYWKYSPWPGVTHGDLTTDNIIDAEGHYGLIDWRPQTHREFPVAALGDVLYDLCKFHLSLLIDLPAVRENRFSITMTEDDEGTCVEVDMPRRPDVDALLNAFYACFSVGTQVRIKRMTPLLMAAMAGVHKEPFAGAIYWYSLSLFFADVSNLIADGKAGDLL